MTALLAFVLAAVAGPAACPDYAAPARVVGRTPSPLLELSGLVASRHHAGIYWAHNDSGNAFELMAMRRSGEVVATYRVRATAAVDAEDVALGPCRTRPDGTCIFVADIGDNFERRREVALFEIAEPVRLESGPVHARRLAFRYEDGSHNAETLLLDAGGAFYVLSKRLDDLGRLYRLEGLGADRRGRAVFVRRLRAPAGFGGLATAGDVHPTLPRALIRTYTGVWEFRGAAGASLADVLAGEPVAVPGATQPQGEAVAYDADGRGYVLASEKTDAPVYHVACREGT